ncbi:hypothetical protein B0H10DRAFT_1945807 [Mycena sp. CBHHK59/15]|nr:hypothetical protein B0H10DRAFT_1945807 [Mycena sp. CBHHK59/15]
MVVELWQEGELERDVSVVGRQGGSGLGGSGFRITVPVFGIAWLEPPSFQVRSDLGRRLPILSPDYPHIGRPGGRLPFRHQATDDAEFEGGKQLTGSRNRRAHDTVSTYACRMRTASAATAVFVPGLLFDLGQKIQFKQFKNVVIACYRHLPTWAPTGCTYGAEATCIARAVAVASAGYAASQTASSMRLARHRQAQARRHSLAVYLLVISRSRSPRLPPPSARTTPAALIRTPNVVQRIRDTGRRMDWPAVESARPDTRLGRGDAVYSVWLDSGWTQVGSRSDQWALCSLLPTLACCITCALDTGHTHTAVCAEQRQYPPFTSGGAQQAIGLTGMGGVGSMRDSILVRLHGAPAVPLPVTHRWFTHYLAPHPATALLYALPALLTLLVRPRSPSQVGSPWPLPWCRELGGAAMTPGPVRVLRTPPMSKLRRRNIVDSPTKRYGTWVLTASARRAYHAQGQVWEPHRHTGGVGCNKYAGPHRRDDVSLGTNMAVTALQRQEVASIAAAEAQEDEKVNGAKMKRGRPKKNLQLEEEDGDDEIEVTVGPRGSEDSEETSDVDNILIEYLASFRELWDSQNWTQF